MKCFITTHACLRGGGGGGSHGLVVVSRCSAPEKVHLGPTGCGKPANGKANQRGLV